MNTLQHLVGNTQRRMPCLHETRLENVTQYNRNVNLPQVNVSRVNKAKAAVLKLS